MNKRRPKPRKKRLFPVLLGVIAVACWFTWAPAMRVSDVEIRGTRFVPAEPVREVAAVPRGSHLWFGVDPDRLSRDIAAAFPSFDAVAVTRSFPGKIVVAVQESVPVARAVTSWGEYVVTARGIVLSGPTGLATQLPALIVELEAPLERGQALPEEYLAAVRTAEQIVVAAVAGIERIETVDGQVSLVTDDGITVLVGPYSPIIEQRLNSLPYILDDARRAGYDVDVVDISHPGQTIIKTKE